MSQGCRCSGLTVGDLLAVALIVLKIIGLLNLSWPWTIVLAIVLGIFVK